MTIRFRSLALPLMLGALTFAPIAQAVDASLTTQPTYRYQLIDTFEVKGASGRCQRRQLLLRQRQQSTLQVQQERQAAACQ